MKNILLTEKFFAMQGEGCHIGTPSIFIRAFGCSLRCQGFGRHHSDTEKYIDVIDLSKITKLDDVPILDWGCDTPAAIWPEAKHLQEKHTKESLWEEIKSMLPDGQWTNETGNDIHLVFTGGESLLPGWQKFYVDFFTYLLSIDQMPRNVSFETNCTKALSIDLIDFILDLQQEEWYNFTFCCSPKLSTSGETFDDRYHPEVIKQYCSTGSIAFLKFVVENEAQVLEAKELIKDLNFDIHSTVPVYLMPVGGTNEIYMQNKVVVHDLAIKHGFRFSPRLQCEVSENKWGT
jgi:7-carboxy-7-deazaguanine synthase